MAISEHLQQINKLLGENKADEARRYVEMNISPDLHAAKKRYEEFQKIESAARNIINLTAGEASDDPAPKPTIQLDLTKPPKDRDQVLEISANLAKKNGGTIDIADVVSAIEAAGIKLDSTRPGTSIGNILYRSPETWERLDVGIFRLKEFSNG